MELRISASELAHDEEIEIQQILSKLEVRSRSLLWFGRSVQHAARRAGIGASKVAHAQRAQRSINSEVANLAQFANAATEQSRVEGPYSMWSTHQDSDEILENLQRTAQADTEDLAGRESVAHIVDLHQKLHDLTQQATDHIDDTSRSLRIRQRLAQEVEVVGRQIDNEIDEYSAHKASDLNEETMRLRSFLKTTEILIACACLGIVAIVFGAIRITSRTIKSLYAIASATEQIADGRLDVVVPVNSDDEIGHLASSFNRMAESLAASLEEQRRAEDRLKLKVSALHAAANAVIITQTDGTIIWVNSAFTGLTGYAADEVIGDKPRLLHSGHHSKAFYADLWNTIQTGRIWHSEIINRRKDGSHYTEEMTITPVKSAAGEITHFIAIKQDISARKAAEKAIRLSEERFKLVAQATHDQIWDCEIATGVVWRGAGYWPHFGYPPKEFEPDLSSWEELVHPDDRERMWNEYSYALARQSKSYESEYRFKRGDGSYATVIDRGYILYDESRRAVRVIGAMRDVSERRQLEEQFRQAQKLEAVGRLAGGIAHDFNNLLMIITSAAQLMELHIEDNSKEKRDLGRILKAADRAAGLTQQLLAFGRKQVLAPRVIDLNAIVDETMAMLKRTLGEDIDLAFRRGRNVPSVIADPSQICQIVLNLCVNARDAMPRGGMLTVQTSALHVDSYYARLHPGTAPGDYALLSVTDNGEGMTKEVQQQLFDPFFTTKEQGKGTGLGLATVYGIVKQSGGYISVYSEVGRGSTFRILLPSSGEVSPVMQKEEYHALSGCETVMLVEDEDELRESIGEFLAANGYKPIQAASGAEALQILERGSERIDVLLTDVVMPTMSGRELAETALVKWPGLKVIYMSGYTDDAIVRHGVLEANTAFLQKPFSLRDLSDKLQQTY